MSSKIEIKKGSKCPSCKKGKLVEEEFVGDKILVCDKCGWDSTDPDLQVFGGGRNTQREKGRHSPYRSGGGIGTR